MYNFKILDIHHRTRNIFKQFNISLLFNKIIHILHRMEISLKKNKRWKMAGLRESDVPNLRRVLGLFELFSTQSYRQSGAVRTKAERSSTVGRDTRTRAVVPARAA